ncbi:inactive CLIP domain-containing serine protease A8-like [Macrobrachium rosenbergii]|uniref:inactive CLIP domain-containing serine protease A8-like n=1 Tax=Macrobrachium rosenbergii TaxID=79674 RepID=UPI0034D7A432
MRLATLTLSLLLLGLSKAHPQYPSGGGGGANPPVPPVAPVAPVTAAGCPPHTHDCVPYYQCLNGTINTSGAGLIDVRIKPQGECVNPEYPEVPSVCCRIPGATPPALEACQAGKVCVLQEQCRPDGKVNTDGAGLIDTRLYKSCYITPGSQVIGVCCAPPVPTIDKCPADSVCLPGALCLGQILDSSNGYQPHTSQATWMQCPLSGSNKDKGICCRNPPAPVIDTCPGDSVCLPEILCSGDILDDANGYQAQGSQATWTQCPLDSSNKNKGVCCLIPQQKPLPFTAADKCGIRHEGLGVKTLKKNEASFGEFPWQAVLFFKNFTFKCGATLVTDKHLLTGAHCIQGYKYGDFKIRLGEWTVNTYDEPLPYLDVDIASITVHPGFNGANLHNDIAVIELTAPVKFQYHINTVCLPIQTHTLQPGTRCFATGWGKNAFEGTYQATLKKVDVPFVEHKYCQDLLRKTRLGKYFVLDKSFMCAGGEENQDACTGDGGGPLVCQDPVTGAYSLWGITAWGINCGQKDVPGVYVDVQHFADFISQALYGVAPVQVTAPHNPYGRK